MRVTFNSGNWVEILPITGLKAKHKDIFDLALQVAVPFDEEGKPELTSLNMSFGLVNSQRDAMIAVLVSAWSFTEDGEEGGRPILLPQWDPNKKELSSTEDMGDIGLDDWNELEDLLRPYLAKLRRRPDPKETTISGSNGSSKGRAVPSRKG